MELRLWISLSCQHPSMDDLGTLVSWPLILLAFPPESVVWPPGFLGWWIPTQGEGADLVSWSPLWHNHGTPDEERQHH